MHAPLNEYSFDLAAAIEAARVWRERTPTRNANQAHLAQGELCAVEPKARLAKHANRLLAHVRSAAAAAPDDADVALSEELTALLHQGQLDEDDIDDVVMERVIGETRDFLSGEFLERGAVVLRRIGRIGTDLPRGRRSFGTGFLVSPRLLLTNHHVLSSAARAAASVVEFDYQLNRVSAPRRVQQFRLEPDTFFLNDQALDFALVAVSPMSDAGTPLATYGWCPLIPEEGKIVHGRCVNIVQHPRGEMKQIVIRQNELVDILDNHLHYVGDTEPGSSGSPVFSDGWEVVALHHSAVPKTDGQGNLVRDDGVTRWTKGDDPLLLGWTANEGVRISKIVAAIRNASVRPHEVALRDEVLKAEEPTAALIPNSNSSFLPSELLVPNSHRGESPVLPQPILLHADSAPSGLTVTIPLQITFTFGTPIVGSRRVVENPSGQLNDSGGQTDGSPVVARSRADGQVEVGLEAITPDPNYDDRPGFDVDFLSTRVAMPTLDAVLQRDALTLDDGSVELKYHHFSVIMNRRRRLAFVAGANFDPHARHVHTRDGGDRWFFDPRISKDAQAGNEYYARNPLDRGHLVRRADAAWGATRAEAKRANDDTFHFTNCSPQHEIYNQSSKASERGLLLWGGLENHVASEGARGTSKLSIFNGPVFRSRDTDYKGLQLPHEFWKVIAFERDDASLGAAAFVLSQADLIDNIPDEDFESGDYEPFQVSIHDLERLTRLDFGDLRKADALETESNEARLEGGTRATPIRRLRDVAL
ncbi:MAG: DNA/RNA non-specific endonuclease [Gemmatimonadota bacterium]